MSQQAQYPTTAEEFNTLVTAFKDTLRWKEPMMYAIGGLVRTRNLVASVRYPVVNGSGQNTGTAAILMKVLGIEPVGVQTVELTHQLLRELLKYFEPFKNDGKRHENIHLLRSAFNVSGSSTAVVTFIFDDIDPVGVEDSTLKLYAMSNRLHKPNTLNLTKIFTKLPNVAWHGDTPMDSDEIDDALDWATFGNDTYSPGMVDKFPLYIHRINAVKMGVRITDEHKVRLGAYLGEGTTLMPGASYVNFNAGTDGGMIEGRISSSAFVGKGSDLGGGSSMLGVLSGGNDQPVSIGRNCLLEANCVLGVPLGDACIVAADTAVLGGSRVLVLLHGHPMKGKSVRASELAGVNAVTFRRNDTTGQLEAIRTKRNEEFARKLDDGEDILNADLHNNN